MTTWRHDKSKEWNLEQIAQSKTVKDLFKYAFDWFGLEENRVREILKSRGFEKFQKENWWKMLDVLMEEWSHVKELKKEPGWDKSRRQKLIELVSKLEKKIMPDGTWYLDGPKESLEALLELDELDRRRNVERMIRRYGREVKPVEFPLYPLQ